MKKENRKLDFSKMTDEEFFDYIGTLKPGSKEDRDPVIRAEGLRRELNMTQEQREAIIGKWFKKESYRLPEDFPMYDMCFCTAHCKTPCARKKGMSGIYTASNFSKHCTDFKPEDSTDEK